MRRYLFFLVSFISLDLSEHLREEKDQKGTRGGNLIFRKKSYELASFYPISGFTLQMGSSFFLGRQRTCRLQDLPVGMRLLLFMMYFSSFIPLISCPIVPTISKYFAWHEYCVSCISFIVELVFTFSILSWKFHKPSGYVCICGRRSLSSRFC